MSDHVCPWWMAYTFDNPLRRLVHNPEKILGGLVEEGHTAIDIGCGMGFFSIAMAKMVGEQGSVIAVDLQQKMLDVLTKRAKKAGVLPRIRVHKCEAHDVGIHEPVDFALAFNVVHEVPDAKSLFLQVGAMLKANARFLVVEPRMHVTPEKFSRSVEGGLAAGLKQVGEPRITLSRAALFSR